MPVLHHYPLVFLVVSDSHICFESRIDGRSSGGIMAASTPVLKDSSI